MAELDLTVEETIDGAVDDVWTYVARDYFAHHSSWDPAIVEMTQLTPGAIGVGTRGREVRAFGGKQAAEFEITEFRDRERFAFVNTSGPFEVERCYALEEQAGRTQLAFTFRMRPKGAMKLVFPLVKGKIAAQVRENIGRIPSLVPGP